MQIFKFLSGPNHTQTNWGTYGSTIFNLFRFYFTVTVTMNAGKKGEFSPCQRKLAGKPFLISGASSWSGSVSWPSPGQPWNAWWRMEKLETKYWTWLWTCSWYWEMFPQPTCTDKWTFSHMVRIHNSCLVEWWQGNLKEFKFQFLCAWSWPESNIKIRHFYFKLKQYELLSFIYIWNNVQKMLVFNSVQNYYFRCLISKEIPKILGDQSIVGHPVMSNPTFVELY